MVHSKLLTFQSDLGELYVLDKAQHGLWSLVHHFYARGNEIPHTVDKV